MNALKLNELKKIASELGAVPTGDKRKKQAWIDAIEAKQRESKKAEPVKARKPRKSKAQIASPLYELQLAEFALGSVKPIEIDLGEFASLLPSDAEIDAVFAECWAS